MPQVDPAKIKTIVDIGANIGLSALYFLKKYPRAKFICVEPEPGNFALLSQNLSLEITRGKVSTLCAAVIDKDGTVSFKSEAAKYNSKVQEGGGQKNVKAVNMSSVHENFALDHIDLLKIDVEGAEKYIFSGNTSWLDKIDNNIIELHSALDYEVCMNVLNLHQFVVAPLNVCPGNENLFWAIKIEMTG